LLKNDIYNNVYQLLVLMYPITHKNYLNLFVDKIWEKSQNLSIIASIFWRYLEKTSPPLPEVKTKTFFKKIFVVYSKRIIFAINFFT